MYAIDLLKGQGIPARSRPEGIVVIAITTLVPVIVAIAMVGVYLSNKVIINVQKQEVAGFERKIDNLSEAMGIYKSYSQKKGRIQQCLTEASNVIGRRSQWSDILVAIVENMPESLVLKRLSLKQSTTRVKVPDKDNPDTKVEMTVPFRTLSMSLDGPAGKQTDKAVKEFREKLRSSSVLSSKVEDMPVSQEVDFVGDKEMITYELKCIFRPQI